MDVARIARCWFPDAASLEIDSWNSGFSGGRVYRVRPAAQPFCFALKALPALAPPPRWHAFAHQLNDSLAKQASKAASPTWFDSSHEQPEPLLDGVSNTHGLLPSPLVTSDGRYFVNDASFRWQCSPWVAGRPCDDEEATAFPADPSPNSETLIRLGAEAIAAAHARLLDLPSPAGHDGTESTFPTTAAMLPRCLRDRAERLRSIRSWLMSPMVSKLPGTTAEWSALLARAIQEEVSAATFGRTPDRMEELANQMSRAAEVLRRHAATVHPRLESELSTYCEMHSVHSSNDEPSPWRSSWVLRDVHREHVFFDEGRTRVTGIIDHDSMDWDLPIVDLARWAGSFPVQLETVQLEPAADGAVHSVRLAWAVRAYAHQCEARWEQKRTEHGLIPFSSTKMADHAQRGPFRWQSPSPEEVALGDSLMRINAWVSLANWVEWIGLRRRVFHASPKRLGARISGLIDSVCHFC
ncbi:phosphotransferase [Rhodopirellula sp. JC740]|uniref:Phosphotransferase n=1 Tax=Rhodopirellula halodulae TaxID=2894198 RepID=A0ABS8NGJ5_9BACT|nr:phosphotransferase [Rhodopirellula sp. JC740]MCC9642674.1 phosphotransferase [Rhodopirellula sp. JC740]